jgi:general secretion pathway protein G
MPTLPRATRKPPAFTLIELLAVIAIIGVLGAVIIPLTGKIRKSARSTECVNNLRQIGGALFLYAADHGSCLPPVADPYPAEQEKMWQHAIWTYLGYELEAFNVPENDFAGTRGRDDNIFHCPETRDNPVAAPTVSSGVNGNKMSYGLNPRGAGTGSSPIPLARVTTPGRTSMVNETSYCLGGAWGYSQFFGLLPHGDGTNVLFYDGHVEFRTFGSIPSDRSDPFWQ